MDEIEAGPPLFILSFRQRDELAEQAARAGWRVVAARRRDGVEWRLLASGAAVAVIDARGAIADGLAATRDLGEPVAANGGALLAMVSRGDVGEIAAFFEAGATHFLASPATELEFVQALRFAARHAERMTGGWRAARGREMLGWRCDPAGGAVRLTPALAARLGRDDHLTPRQLIRSLDASERHVALAAMRRLGVRGATAFAHDLPPFGRVVEHLQRDPATGAIDSLIEPLGTPPDAAAQMRTAWAGKPDAAAARRWLAERGGEGAGTTSVLLVALTRFDIVNLAYGRAAGDAILRTALRRIEEVARALFGADAVVARVAGSQFLLGIADAGDRAALAASRIADALGRPFAVDGAVALLGSRIGIAEQAATEDVAALLRRASEALAQATASDGATVSVAGSDGGAPADLLAIDLHHALERGEIEVRFQPQVAVATGRIEGVEALARWDHPRLGALGAETLFAAAERADLGIALSDHLQQLALGTAAAWRGTLATLRLSINLTAADLARADFAELFLARVAASGFPLARLTVEITETGLIADLGAAASFLSALRAVGCRVAIDDFGTGYSSLAYLKALPLDYLKVDKAMTQDIAGSARDRVVVRGVIDMARSLALGVIAEGVETRAQLDLLAQEGCNYYQGFLCAGALDETALAALVEG